jgi:threonyl-tRNA synthetase
MAHVMAQAVLRVFPDAGLAIGPPIEDGFYYDFDLPQPPTAADLERITAEMKAIIRGGHEFKRREISADEGLAMFRGQKQVYKVELIEDLLRDEPGVSLSTYTQDTFEDLCRGPHVANTRELNPEAFSIHFREPAGAYWRGDETRPMLTRIYGTAWETPEDLADYLHRLEEAKKRDHKVLGVQMGLFTFSQLVGKGLPLWKPKGAVIRDLLERFLRDEQIKRGYDPVLTPHIAKVDLYKTSGHYPYYADSQFNPIDVDGELFMLKPMNCPHHIQIYKSELRSYKDLPIRYAEFGTVYRYEQSGELSGLTRVRGFTVDDAHLFVTPDQLLGEFIAVVQLIQYVFGALGLHEFKARVGTRDPNSNKYVGDPAVWEQATAAIIQACEQMGLDYFVAEGEAAFYGPKLDFIFRDVLKREWQLGTVQVDYNLPERFEMEYIGDDNHPHRPVMIHRAPFGSLERFIGILIEHFYGHFPFWLAPTQVGILTVSNKMDEAGRALASTLEAAGLRVQIFQKGQVGKKIAEARAERIPHLLIFGPRDMENGTVSLRLRDDTEIGAIPLAEYIVKAQALVRSHALGIWD